MRGRDRRVLWRKRQSGTHAEQMSEVGGSASQQRDQWHMSHRKPAQPRTRPGLCGWRGRWAAVAGGLPLPGCRQVERR